MSQSGIQASAYRFDDFYLDARNRQLWRGDRLLPLNSRYFDVLLLLVSQSGRLVEKRRIFEEVWQGVFVTDAALTQCIKDIRKQLGDDASNPRYIKTVPKHGYLFIGEAQARTPALDAPDISEAQQAAANLKVSARSRKLSASHLETAEANAESVSRAPAIAPRPYKFLDYYTEQDAQLFFGREAEVDSICTQILAHRSFILHGRSGVGKSSILRAGVMPRLKSRGHQVFAVRSFTDPLHQMASALTRSTGLDTAGEPTARLESLIKQAVRGPDASHDNRFVIFFLDQFEEFFSLLAEESRKQFIEALARLAANESLPLRLVFTLREDFLAEMSQLKSAIPEIFHHEYRLKRLSREQAALAITEPAKAVGCHYEPELVARLLDDLSDGASIDPPQLQIVCDNLYDSRDERATLTVAAYERLGTASQILAGYLERVMRRFGAADLQAAREILTEMISGEGQRLVLKASALCSRIDSRASSGVARAEDLLEELVAARVARRRSLEGEAWIELAHDFMTSEILRWLTDEDRALKKAKGVLERAVENYRAHRLIIDTDALDLLLPFGERLGVNGEQAELLITSVLHRARSVPAWLAAACPDFPRLIAEASLNADPGVRLCAVGSSSLLRNDDTKGLLRRLALWDSSLAVRKAASIALGEWLPRDAARLLSEGEDGKKIGLIRRAISLAMIRDHDKHLIRLSELSLPVVLLVLLALVWVRLRRGGAEIIRLGLGGTLGGAASGLIGGVMLGLALATARQASLVEASSLTVVLVALGSFIGTVGASGVSFGMVAASHITYRHSRWWSVAGGALGGCVVGGASNLFGVDIMRAVFGRTPEGITGALEGALIGAGVALGAVLASKLRPQAAALHKAAGAALGSMCAAILLAAIGGNLFSGSLEIVARSFADSQIRMDPLAPFFGEVHFGQTTRIILGAIEGLLFGAGTLGGMELFARARRYWAALGEPPQKF